MNAQATYTVGQLAKAAGTSTRALRHYEEVGLLTPARNKSGYRVYSAADAHKLAQILAMRACGLSLTTIKHLLEDPTACVRDALVAHLKELRAQQESLACVARRTEAAIAAIERIEGMDAKDAFETMKEEGLAQFEAQYGAEARERYGDAAIDATNERLMALNQSEWDAKELLEESIKAQLRLVMAAGNTSGEEAAELARMHARWIRIHWGNGYSREAHLGLARGYLDDPRFVAYYDEACGEGATQALVDSLEANL